DRLPRPQVCGRGVTDDVGVRGEQRVDIVGGGDTDGRESTELARIASHLRVRVHTQPDELEVGMLDDPVQRLDADVARAPLDDAVAHGPTVSDATLDRPLVEARRVAREVTNMPTTDPPSRTRSLPRPVAHAG